MPRRHWTPEVGDRLSNHRAAHVWRLGEAQTVGMHFFSDDALCRLDMPVLAIVGGRDVLLDSPKTRSRLERHAPNAEVLYLPEAGHFIPGQTGKIRAFLSRDLHPRATTSAARTYNRPKHDPQ